MSRIGPPSTSPDEVSVRMRLFSNVPLILLLVAIWPLILLSLVVACEWLERRTLAPKAVVPRRLRRMRRAAPEQVEQMVLRETADVVARYWAATGETATNGTLPGAVVNGAPAGAGNGKVPGANGTGVLPRAANGAPASGTDNGNGKVPGAGGNGTAPAGGRAAGAGGRGRAPAEARAEVRAERSPARPR